MPSKIPWRKWKFPKLKSRPKRESKTNLNSCWPDSFFRKQMRRIEILGKNRCWRQPAFSIRFSMWFRWISERASLDNCKSVTSLPATWQQTALCLKSLREFTDPPAIASSNVAQKIPASSMTLPQDWTCNFARQLQEHANEMYFKFFSRKLLQYSITNPV